MKRMLAYLIALLTINLTLYFESWIWPCKPLMFQCILIGMIGGILYCIRSTYMNFCVRDSWDDKWILWYYLRPVASAIVGLAAFVFLKAGLLALDSSTGDLSFGFESLAFIGGYNVDGFLKKLEEVGGSVYGIGKSRGSNQAESE